MTKDDNQTLLEMRAKRLKRLRNLANLSRDEMCADDNINRNTLIGWENARFGGLTAGGAKKVIARVTQEGVYCNLDWLMQGTGPEPSVNPMGAMDELDCSSLDEETIIHYELAFFKSKNADAVAFKVHDDSMLPVYNTGDYVAGRKKVAHQIQCVIGYDCIVETADHHIMLRNVRAGSTAETFTLVCNNTTIKDKTAVIAEVKLHYAAPVIWHRRKDIFVETLPI